MDNRDKKGRFKKGHNNNGGLSEAHKRKISEKLKGIKRKPQTDEVKRKISESLKGRTPWNNGVEHSEEAKAKMSKAKLGKKRKEFSNEKSWNWKGDKISYNRLHNWKLEKDGNPKKCEHCGKIGKYNIGKVRKTWNIQWANKSRKYKRDLNDWIGLCIKCHRKYDKDNTRAIKKKYKGN